MKYAWFERIVLVLGGASILLTFGLTYGSTLFLEEVAAQVMLFVVLFAAVHWGRRGGFVAALAASLVYILLRIPLVTADPTVTSDVLVMILTRVVAYGLIGIVGGEIAMRMKYVLAGLEDASSVDQLSGLYNERIMGHALESARGRFARYGEPFSVVIVDVDPSTSDGFKPAKQRAVIRGVAGYIRNDIRLVDEAGRLADGRFIILLPHTAKEGAGIVAERLAKGVRGALHAGPELVQARTIGASDDFELADLNDRLSVGSGDQPVSPAYRSLGSRTLKPEERSTSAAASSSTLSTSTAAPPRSPTKQ